MDDPDDDRRTAARLWISAATRFSSIVVEVKKYGSQITRPVTNSTGTSSAIDQNTNFWPAL